MLIFKGKYSNLPQSCCRDEKVPKFSFILLGSFGAVGGRTNLQIDACFSVGVISTRLRGLRASRAAHVPSHREAKTMQVPSILRGESRTRLLQGIAIGAVASVVIGFSWGGWTTSGAANKLAAEQANTAVVAALTPLCVEKFFQSGDAKANLLVLQKISTNWEQGAFLEKGGWATRPGAASSDYNLARACAEKLVEAKAATQ